MVGRAREGGGGRRACEAGVNHKQKRAGLLLEGGTSCVLFLRSLGKKGSCSVGDCDWLASGP